MTGMQLYSIWTKGENQSNSLTSSDGEGKSKRREREREPRDNGTSQDLLKKVKETYSHSLPFI
jgi:hypothetical protein